MSYACWRLWVGVCVDDIDVDEVPENTWEMMNKLYEEPCEIKKLKIERFYIPGESGGIGVTVTELDWTDEDQVFDLKHITKAKRMIPRLQKVFDRLEIRAPILIRHHIDLSG